MATVHPLIDRVKQQGNPLIDGEQVTFVWQGESAPQLMGDFTDWERGTPITLEPVAAEVWAHRARFPLDAYLEYSFCTAEDGRWRDPFNTRMVSTGYRGSVNFYFDMPERSHTPLIQVKRGVPRGVFSTHQISGGFAIVGERRWVGLYQPPVREPVPLLVVLDGQDYWKRAKLTTLVDNLIAQGRIQPVALALVQHGAAARFVEYMCSDATLHFLTGDVIPLAQAHLNLLPLDSGTYGILGASMGGLTALYAGLRLPQCFGTVISQSGAFGFRLMGQDTVIHDLVRYLPPRNLHITLDVGRYEWFLSHSQAMRDTLQAAGYALGYREHPGGHNWTSWRDELPQALEAMYPPDG
jgi:enterochelin esterase-like enzyme